MLRRTILILILSTMAFGSSWAETYIKDVAVTGCYYKKQVDEAKARLTRDGYTVIQRDVNSGAGAISYFIFIGYKTTNKPSDAITLLAVTTSTTNGTSTYSVTFHDKKYDLRPAPKYYNSDGDLNQNAGGWYLYLYYSKSHAGELDEQMYTDLDVSGSQQSAVPCYDVSGGRLSQKESCANLNRGHMGADLFLNAPQHSHSMTFQSAGSKTHDYKCNKCGISISYNHVSKSNTTNRNDTYHWGECEKCGQELGKQQHLYVRSSTTTTQHSRVCSNCHYIVNDAHKFGSFNIIDEEQHMYVCSDAMCSYRKELPHTWGSQYETIVPATTEHAGIIQYKCNDCNATHRETLPQIVTESSIDRLFSELVVEESATEEAIVENTIEDQHDEDFVNVYNLSGQCILRHVPRSEAIDQLTPGQVYIINGKRYIISD